MLRDKKSIIDKLYMKLKNIRSRKINLEKAELTKFINYLINNN